MRTQQILHSMVGVLVGVWAAGSVQAATHQIGQNTSTNRVIEISETSSQVLFSYNSIPEYTAYRAVRFSKTFYDDWVFFKDVEYGDEITLDNGGRGFNALTKFILEYWNGFEHPLDERTVTLRLYVMDGPPSAGSYGHPTPGTLLYEATKVLDPSGTLVFDLTTDGEPLFAPSNIAWTVQFKGPLTEYQTGLWVADEVQIGSSYDDFWVYDPEQGWTLYQFANGQPANFAATVLAVPEPSTIALFLLGLGGMAWIARKRR